MMRGCIAFLLLVWKIGSSEAVNSVRASKSCYLVGESIVITFSLTSPSKGDWIGLTNSSTSLSGGAFYPQFVYTCGSTSCTGAPASGTLSFFNNLGTGSYKAVLLQSDTFTSLAVGTTFTVSKGCLPVAPTRPVSIPTQRPITAPILRPSNINIAAAKKALKQASAQIEGMVRSNRLLLQQYLRLLFHDCHGICDGCVDLSNMDNGVLNFAISGLDPIVQQFANPQTGLSRSDIWVLAMNIALNNANQLPATKPVRFEMNWIGRVDCEKRNPNGCTDAQGITIPCGATSGPKLTIAPVNMNSLDFANFWKTNFKGLSLRHAIALMGCHTVGRTFTQVSGIDGPNGWVADNASFNNEYFQALLGSHATPNMSIPELLTYAPGWTRAFQANPGTTLPTRNFWSLTAGGKNLVMLDADIAAVRQLDTSNMNSATGAVGCAFSKQTGQPVCPAANTITIAAQFLDNDTWLVRDINDVMTKYKGCADTFCNEQKTVKEGLDLMTTNGYKRGSCPAGQLCVLS